MPGWESNGLCLVRPFEPLLWKDVLERQAWVDFFLKGDKLPKFLDDELAMYEKIAKELGLVQ